MTHVRWNGNKVMAAFTDLTDLLRGNPDGALGYKAGVIRGVLENAAINLSRQSTALREKYQATVPSDKGPRKLPFEQDGKPLDLGFWCTSPEQYKEEEKRILEVELELDFPVRLSYNEVARHREPVRDVSGSIAGWQGVRGTFWVHLSDLIDPPAPPAAPAVPSTATPNNGEQ